MQGLVLAPSVSDDQYKAMYELVMKHAIEESHAFLYWFYAWDDNDDGIRFFTARHDERGNLHCSDPRYKDWRFKRAIECIRCGVLTAITGVASFSRILDIMVLDEVDEVRAAMKLAEVTQLIKTEVEAGRGFDQNWKVPPEIQKLGGRDVYFNTVLALYNKGLKMMQENLDSNLDQWQRNKIAKNAPEKIRILRAQRGALGELFSLVLVGREVEFVNEQTVHWMNYCFIDKVRDGKR